jgi:hypothetical protein
MSSIDSPARDSAIFEAGTGPIPITAGSTPTTPHEMRRPIGFNPR